MRAKWLILVVLFSVAYSRKSVLDFTDEDIDRLSEQWEDDEEEDEIDKRKGSTPPPMPSLPLDGSIDPQKLIKMTKKNQPVMIFVQMAAPTTRDETDKLSSRWAVGLLNGHIPTQRYIVNDDRVLYMIEEGSRAWDAKEYLVQQEECVDVTLEQVAYPCKGQKSTTKSKASKREDL